MNHAGGAHLRLSGEHWRICGDGANLRCDEANAKSDIAAVARALAVYFRIVVMVSGAEGAMPPEAMRAVSANAGACRRSSRSSRQQTYRNLPWKTRAAGGAYKEEMVNSRKLNRRDATATILLSAMITADSKA